MVFEFDRVKYQVIDAKISLCLGILVILALIVEFLIGTHSILLLTTLIPSVIYLAHKGLSSEAFFKEKQAQIVKVVDSRLIILNQITGYEFSRDLNKVRKVKYKTFLGFSIVVVEFTSNEYFQFFCYKNSEHLFSLLNKEHF